MQTHNQTLDPHAADPFDAYHAVFVDKRRLQKFLAAALALNVLTLLVLLAAVLRPAHVIVKDRIAGAPPILARAGVAPPINATDARVFFMHVLQLRFGWSSATVRRDMQTYLGQCLKEQRTRELDYLSEAAQQTPSETGPAPRTRLQAWEQAELSNTLIWPAELDDIVCSPQPQGLWRCEATAQIVTQGPQNASDETPPVRTTFLAALYPVRHTVHTPSGLVVGHLRHVVTNSRSTP